MTWSRDAVNLDYPNNFTICIPIFQPSFRSMLRGVDIQDKTVVISQCVLDDGGLITCYKTR